MPLSPIPLQKNLQSDPSPPLEIGRDGFHLEQKFDLMNIEITIYSLSGIVCRGCKKKVRKEGKRRKKASSKNGTDMIGDKEPTLIPTMIPTTAVVSCRRNILSSGTSIETFLPSQSIGRSSLASDQILRQTAVWRYADGTSCDTDTEEDSRCTTFAMSRVMKRQSFDPLKKAPEISNYVPETIEINVGLLRGREKISLAEASIVVTGEEENDTLLSVPVKALSKAKSKLSFLRPKNKERKRKEAIFALDAGVSYELEENAILRVGVKTSPVTFTGAGEGQGSNVCTQETKTLDDILAGMFDENNMILELDDENSLLRQFISTPSGRSPRSRQVPNSDVHKKRMAVAQESSGSFAEFLCGAMAFICEDSALDPVPESKEDSDQSNEEGKATIERNKKTSALVLPLSLMSSVSESTFESFRGSPRSFGRDKKRFDFPA